MVLRSITAGAPGVRFELFDRHVGRMRTAEWSLASSSDFLFCLKMGSLIGPSLSILLHLHKMDTAFTKKKEKFPDGPTDRMREEVQFQRHFPLSGVDFLSNF